MVFGSNSREPATIFVPPEPCLNAVTTAGDPYAFPTFSIAIETENLASARLDDLRACLDSLAAQDLSIRLANEVFLIDTGHVGQQVIDDLKACYPWLRVHRASRSLSYYASKNLGARLATGEIIIFADSDVTYDRQWLRSLLDVLRHRQDAAVVCGDTEVRATDAFSLAMSLVWIMPILAPSNHTHPTKSYRANNVAFRRERLLDEPLLTDELPLYRAQISLHARKMLARGCELYRQPLATAWHAPPERFVDWLWRMLVMGSDSVALSRYRIGLAGDLTQGAGFIERLQAFFRKVRWKARNIRARSEQFCQRDPDVLRHLPLARPIVAASFGLYVLGAFVTCVLPEVNFRRALHSTPREQHFTAPADRRRAAPVKRSSKQAAAWAPGGRQGDRHVFRP